MNKLLSLFLVVFAGCSQSESSVSDSQLAYLGQSPPGNTPELFAPGVVSTGVNEMSICFSEKGDEVFLLVARPTLIITSKIKNGEWTSFEEPAFIDSARSNYYMFLSPNGKKMFFTSTRPDGDSKDSVAPNPGPAIWVTERSEGMWDTPQKVDFGDEFKGTGSFPSVADNGNLYFSSFDNKTISVYCSKYVNGKYTTPIRLSDSINQGTFNSHVYIAPDESYLLFDSRGRDDVIGGVDIYISFRDENGNWTKAQNIGDKINSESSDMRSYVSTDGQYFFFCSSRQTKNRNLPAHPMKGDQIRSILNAPGNGQQDIYWVSASFIDDLKKLKFNLK